MKTDKRKNNSFLSGKLSFLKDLRFLIVVFSLVFVLLGGLSLISVSAESGSNQNPVQADTSEEDTKEPNTEPDYTAVFSFKQDTLELTADSEPVTGFLNITNEKALTDCQKDGTCIKITTKPFVITPLKPGEAQITLTAKVRSGYKTITAIITVKETKDTQNPNNSGKDEEETPQYKLEYQTGTDGEFTFSLFCNGTEIYNFTLEVSETVNAEPSIIGRVVSLNPGSNFSVAVSALIDGEPAARIILNNTNILI